MFSFLSLKLSSDGSAELAPMQSESRESRRYRNFNKLLGLNSDEEEEDSEYEEGSPRMSPCQPILESELLVSLCVWLDRLFEGSLRRYHVTQWPSNLNLSNDDDDDWSRFWLSVSTNSFLLSAHVFDVVPFSRDNQYITIRLLGISTQWEISRLEWMHPWK